MENPSASEYYAPGRGDYEWDSVCNGLRMDDERQYRRVFESKSGGKPVWAGRFFIQKLVLLLHSGLID